MEKDSSSESEEEIIDIVSSPNGFWSKDKKVEWCKTPPVPGRARVENLISDRMGITQYAATRIVNVSDAFELCFTPTMRKIVIDMTNIEAERVFSDKWKLMDGTEFDAYLGVLLLSGVYKSNHEAVRSLWNPYYGRPIFASIMSYNRFWCITRALRFDNRSDRPRRRINDKLAPIRDLVDKWVNNLPYLFTPYENVTIDEQLIPFRGRCPFRQYIPSKPAKYGIKAWLACDSKTNFVLNFQVYTGKEPGAEPERNQGHRVVLDLVGPWRGRNITADNFFITYDLGLELLKRKMTLVGTVRANKTFLPYVDKCIFRKRPVDTCDFYFTDKTTIVQYVPKKYKNVTVLSTLHHKNEISANTKPEIINFYNSTKAGVDTLDQLVGCFSVKRKTNRWPVAVFSDIIDISAVNAFVLMLEVDPNWNLKQNHRRRTFLEELGTALVKPEIIRRKYMPRNKNSQETAEFVCQVEKSQDNGNSKPISQGITSEKKRSRCQLCPKKDRKTRFNCVECKKYVCLEHQKSAIYCLNCFK